MWGRWADGWSACWGGRVAGWLGGGRQGAEAVVEVPEEHVGQLRSPALFGGGEHDLKHCSAFVQGSCCLARNTY